MEEQILRGVYPERSRRAQDDKSPEHPSSLTSEQFRRMLEEALAADPNLARRVLWPLSGTVFPIVGGNPATVGRIAKIVNVGPPPVVDDSVMFELSGNLGIGTTSPGTLLDIRGSTPRMDVLHTTINLGNGVVAGELLFGTAGNTVSGTHTADAVIQAISEAAQSGTNHATGLAFLTKPSSLGPGSAALERMRIDNQGNVGIGTTSPGTLLDIRGSTPRMDVLHTTINLGNGVVAGELLFGTAGNTVSGTHTADAVIQAISEAAQSGTNHATGLAFLTKPSSLGPGSAALERMRIDNQGNVGIGTAAPSVELTVQGASGGQVGVQNSTLNLVPNTLAGALMFGTAANVTNIDIYDAGLKAFAEEAQSGSNHATYLSFYTKPNTLGPGSAALERLRITAAGNVGIGTINPDPTAKLDVNGNILSQGLNKIVFLKPTGSGDGTRINTEINNLPSNGGIIYLMPGSVDWSINAKIIINKSGVKLRGYGGATDVGTPLTRLLWAGGAGGTIVELKPANTNTQIEDLELSDLTIDGGNSTSGAGIGLVLDRVLNSKFISIHVQYVKGTPGNGIKLTTTAVGPPPAGNDIGTSWNHFENCTVIECVNGVILTSETTGTPTRAAANTCHNTFVGLNVQVVTGIGIDLVECDNNSFYRTLTPGSANIGVRVANPNDALSNYFYHLQAGGASGFVVQNANLPFTGGKNLIFGYDLENGQQDPSSTPSTSTGSFVFWIDSKGKIHGGQLV